MKKPHVLIVDDDRILRMALPLMLEKLGHEVSEAFNGVQALKILKEDTAGIDAIILDRMMPEMSGIEVLRQITSTPSLRHIPVILLTARAAQEDVREAKACGVFDILYKPVDKITLCDTLEKALSQKE